MSMEMSASKEHTQEYKDCFKRGVLYQDFVMQMLIKHRGLVISNYSSKWFQINIGESQQGVETKLSSGCSTFRNLFIETHKKFKKTDRDWKPSGINRNDNTKIYIIGDYFVFYLFDVKVLRKKVKEERYLKKFDNSTLRGSFTSDTGKGVYVPVSEIEEDECYIDKIECREDGERFIEKLKNQGNEILIA